MAYPVYTRRLGGPLKIGVSGTGVIYTVPVNHSAVVKFITFVNTHATIAASCRVAIGANSTANQIVRTLVVPDTAVLLHVTVALQAGETIHAWAPETGSAVTFMATGYLFNES